MEEHEMVRIHNEIHTKIRNLICIWIFTLSIIVLIETQCEIGIRAEQIIITENTTWALANSPYIITGNVLIEHGITLTIEPGVKVKFDGDYYIQIKGKLTAEGNENNMITFTSNKLLPRPGDWDSIIFMENADNGSIIKYCIIEYGQGSNKYDSVVYIEGGIQTITHNLFQNNYGGIHLDNDRSLKGIFTVKYNTIVYNKGSAGTHRSGNGIIIDGDNFNLDIVLSDNIINNNFGTGIIIMRGVGCSININNNTINRNDYFGIWLEGTNKLLEVKNNLIFGNERCGVNEKMPQIFENNTVAYSEYGILTEGVRNQNYKWQNNNIYNNSVNLKNKEESDWNFNNNWWGTTDTDLINQSIYDYYDDFNFGKINYLPILTEPNPNAPDESGFSNTPPDTPNTPTGRKQGEINKSYDYLTQATDPEGDKIRYGWDWYGIGRVGEWSNFVESGTVMNCSHVWSTSGTYNIKVKVVDEFGEESEWSDVLTVSITKEYIDSETEENDDIIVPILSIIIVIFVVVIVIYIYRRK
jgi:hypothetical protein